MQLVKDETCQICGKPATRFLFAAFVCDDEKCIEKARMERGGPGGHKKQDFLKFSRDDKC